MVSPPTGALRAQRLDRLREHLRTIPAGASPAPADAPVTDDGPAHDALHLTAICPAPSARAESLARVLGGHVVSTARGAITIVETRIRLPADLGRLRELPDPIDPDRPIVCLDTETTGLGTAAGTVPFLVALGRWQGDEFVVRQLLLPDHPDEPAMLEVLERHLPADASLVSYNGRAFDWPLISSRYRLHGRPPPAHAAHLDLLGVARQVWRHRLPDARLASVEAGICGVRRYDDLPGALIPERYFAWLRTGRAELFAEVLEHNRQDVVSLALLLRVLAHDVLPERHGPSRSGSVAPRDLAGLGRLYARRGQASEALACFDQTLERLSAPWRDRDLQSLVAADRARALGRLGRRAEAASAWEAIAMDGGPMAPMAWIAVAKSLEHAARDPAAALVAARRADALAFRLRFLGQPQPRVERDLTRRLPRLVRLAQTGTRGAASAA
jgi:uncharacterized protein YprB with RNaseH-like and TPR domain